MMRRLLNFLTALSLLLCVAVVALWVNDFWYRRGLCAWKDLPGRRVHQLVVETDRSGLYVQVSRNELVGPDDPQDVTRGWRYYTHTTARPKPG